MLPGVGTKIASQIYDLREKKGVIELDDLVTIPYLRVNEQFMRAVDFTKSLFNDDDDEPQGASGPALRDFMEQVRRVDKVIDSRSAPTKGARSGKTPKGGHGEVTSRTPTQDRTPYRTKYAGYREPSPYNDDWEEDSPTDFYGELDSAFMDDKEFLYKEGGDAHRPRDLETDPHRQWETPRTRYQGKTEPKTPSQTYDDRNRGHEEFRSRRDDFDLRRRGDMSFTPREPRPIRYDNGPPQGDLYPQR